MGMYRWMPSLFARKASKDANSSNGETDGQRQVYDLEKENNFRWIASMLKYKSMRVLTIADRCEEDVERQLAMWGAYAELAHGFFRIDLIWENIASLTGPGGQLEAYGTDLSNSKLLATITGENRAAERGYVAFRPEANEIVVAFSGTSSGWQVLQDLNFFMRRYPVPPTWQHAGVHSGFWNVYTGIRLAVAGAIASARQAYPDAKLVLTGHSMGAVMCYLIALDILLAKHDPVGRECFHSLDGMQITMALFGCPRLADAALVESFDRAVADYKSRFETDDSNAFTEYSVKGFRDGELCYYGQYSYYRTKYFLGVHCLPPSAIGFRHICSRPIYLYHGQHYWIPEGDKECSFFEVEPDPQARTPLYPRGGHNYYNNRNMEGLLRGLGVDYLRV